MRTIHFEIGRFALAHEPEIDLIVSLAYPAIDVVQEDFSGFKIALRTEPQFDESLTLVPEDGIRLCKLIVDAVGFIDLPERPGGWGN
jgi:hypothetical protein